MKTSKNINGKRKTNKRNVFYLLVILIFVFFASSSLILYNRNYYYIEKIPKFLIANINKFVTNKIYHKTNSNNYINAKINYLQKENNSLKKILDLKKSNPKLIEGVVTNQIIGTYLNKLEILTNDKIKIGYPVINEYGLVGFIDKMEGNIAEISLITNINRNNMVSVLIEDGDNYISGVLSKYDRKNDLFVITDIIDKGEIKSKDKVILSGYDNNYRGIYVGEVVSVKKSNYGLTKTAYLKSDVKFNNLQYVMVVGV